MFSSMRPVRILRTAVRQPYATALSPSELSSVVLESLCLSPFLSSRSIIIGLVIAAPASGLTFSRRKGVVRGNVAFATQTYT